MEYDSSDLEIIEFIRKGKLDKVKKFVSSVGLSHSKTWQGGYMLLYWALGYNHTNIAKWLLSQNCPVNPENQKFSQKTVLHLAVSLGKAELVKIILKKGASVTVSNDRLETPLHISCKRRKPEVLLKNDVLTIIKLLLKHGAPINAKGGLCEETPLLFAIKNKHHCGKIVKLLLSNGANVNDYDMYRKTALHIAVENSDRKMIKLLLEHNADVNVKNCNGRTPLHLAVRGRYIDIAKMLLSHGADVNDIIYDFEEYRWTALHIAVKNKDEKMIKLLLEYNSNVNAKEDHYRTPLHIASVSHCPDIAKILLNAGADINDADKQGLIPFHLAIRIEDEKMVEFLLQHNANVHAKRDDGKSCLHFAAENRSASIAKILLNKGANINDTTKDGRTVLHFSAKKGSKELVELFLKLGMDVDVKTKVDNFTPLYYAVKKRHCQIAEYLLYHGADVNVPVKVYQTLLRLAVYDMNKEMVELLLNWNANINAEDSDDETPLLIATDSPRYEDIPGSEMMHGITDCLIMYIAKLVAEKLYVSEQDSRLIKQKCRLQLFYDQCQNELANMKNKKIYDNISYYDILTKSTNTMVSYARNKNLTSAFESSDYLNAFPIYSLMMHKNYERGKVKKQLLEVGSIALKFLFKNNTEQKVPVELPYVVNREILNYLDLKDLRILSALCHPSPTQKLL
ncbi:putative ankyrin repeat protein RF_0381 isoform X2 [Nasonia vitripennis]|uniref:Uncharacterized protein n=1 Tax=Nasonia vitripennis TaxID=7425 RepID=A0A7M7H9C2_NASVI|nr:putative ankyrin repeat protein RF_0381 isoform X2 [Nasonia vitripennis]